MVRINDSGAWMHTHIDLQRGRIHAQRHIIRDNERKKELIFNRYLRPESSCRRMARQ
jgi:hypothetical protein